MGQSSIRARLDQSLYTRAVPFSLPPILVSTFTVHPAKCSVNMRVLRDTATLVSLFMLFVPSEVFATEISEELPSSETMHFFYDLKEDMRAALSCTAGVLLCRLLVQLRSDHVGGLSDEGDRLRLSLLTF